MSASARTLLQACVAAGSLALIGSCGGGGGSSEEPGGSVTVVATNPSTSPSPTSTASPAPSASPTASPTSSPTASPSPSGGYQLVWQDEFNGSAMSTRCWGYWWNPTNTPNEMQAFVSNARNTVVKDGMLNLVAYKENVAVNGRTFPYSSSQVHTGEKGFWKYGRFEARIRIPKGAGLWPVFWLLPEDSKYGGWPYSGEVDIAEWIGIRPKEVYNSVHGPGPGEAGDVPTTKVYAAPADMGDDFHTYALEWSATGMKYFFDGVLVNEINRWGQPAGAAFPAPFDQTFYIVMTLGVGGDWPGAPTAQTVFPSTMLVDWVRVYQKVTTTGAPFQCS